MSILQVIQHPEAAAASLAAMSERAAVLDAEISAIIDLIMTESLAAYFE